MRTMVVLALLLALLALLALPAPAAADNGNGRIEVRTGYAVIGGVILDASTAAAKAEIGAAGAAKTSSTIPTGNTERHSLIYKATSANNAAVLTWEIRKRQPWGTFVSFSPAITGTLTGSTAYDGCLALSLPVSAEVRFLLSADGTYATTWTGLAIEKW